MVKKRQDNRVIQEIIPVIELTMEALHKLDNNDEGAQDLGHFQRTRRN